MIALDILRTGFTARYHTVPGNNHQSVAAHSWGVAMLYLHLTNNPNMAAFRWALAHDCAEASTGDIPAQVKWADGDLADRLSVLEDLANKRLDIDSDLSPEDTDLIRIADLLELMWWSLEQVRMGNKNYKEPFWNANTFFMDHSYLLDRNAAAREIYSALIKGMNDV